MEREDFTVPMIRRVSELVAADTLSHANAVSQPVQPNRSFYGRYIKRIIDVVVAFAALAVTLPVNLLIAIITFFDVGAPIFFKQERIGRDNHLFNLVKFRNMKNTLNENGELLPASQRVTKWGKFVRRTSLDELLNFWSILKGDMSLIGPRPLVPGYLDRFSERHKMRTTVRPGLECPPNGAIDGSWSWQDQLENDIWYVEHVSFRTDCHMMVQLVKYTFNRKASAARAAAKRGGFVGYDANGRATGIFEVDQKYIDLVAEEYKNLV